jgi:threonine/homoserine/homoserine lactone efflux protein
VEVVVRHDLSVREVVGDVLALAVAAGISPFPIIGMVLMLVTPRGRTNGPMFLAGWLAGLAMVGAATLALAGAADVGDDGTPSTGADVLRIMLGIALIALAIRQWRKRPQPGDEPKLPKWMSAVDAFSPLQAAGAGAVMSAVNPKNLLLTVAAGTTIASTDLSPGDQLVAFVIYGLIATIGVAAPLVMFFLLGERSAATLDGLKMWLAHNNATIMAVVFLVIGANVLGQGIAG